MLKEIRASELENALLCDAYLRNLLEGKTRIFSDYTERAFFDGRVHEASIIDYALDRVVIERDAIENVVEQPEGEVVIDGVKITGHADALVTLQSGERVIVEAKYISARSIQSIMSAPDGTHRYALQVQAYLAMFNAQRALLVMRNKNTPLGRLYDHFTREIEPNNDLLRNAVARLKKLSRRHKLRGIEDASAAWLCSPTWCCYYHICELARSRAETPVQGDENLIAELDEAIDLYKEINEEYGFVDSAKKQLRDRIVEIMERLNIEKRATTNALAELKRGYRKQLRKDIELPDDYFELAEYKRLTIK